MRANGHFLRVPNVHTTSIISSLTVYIFFFFCISIDARRLYVFWTIFFRRKRHVFESKQRGSIVWCNRFYNMQLLSMNHCRIEQSNTTNSKHKKSTLWFLFSGFQADFVDGCICRNMNIDQTGFFFPDRMLHAKWITFYELKWLFNTIFFPSSIFSFHFRW